MDTRDIQIKNIQKLYGLDIKIDRKKLEAANVQKIKISIDYTIKI
ncbi:hypothetical protein ACUH7Y_25435 [Clostridium beijerinckii]|nr:hypothetical protein [Clostridium beijerinckii]